MHDRSPSALRTSLRGRFDDALCCEFIATVDEWRGARRRVIAFHDATGILDYDVLARDKVSAWLRSAGLSFDGIHVLVDRIGPAWGLNVVAMLTGAKIIPYRSREDFDAAWKQHGALARSGTFTSHG